MPSAVRRGPFSYAFATSEDESGCWQPEPRPATTRQASRATKLPVRPAIRKPRAVTAVPATSSRASPRRSARMPAGTWKAAMPPV